MFRELVAAKRAERARLVEATFVAYQTVKCWVKTKNKKRMPDFASLLPAESRAGRSGRQSDRQMLSALQIIGQQYGLPLRDVKPKVPRG